MSGRRDYFGMSRLVSLIFAIIPVTSWIFGFVTRFQEGKMIAGIIRLVFGWNIIWVLDLVCILFQGRICRILNV
jgi:hypothetical protein